HSGPMVRPVREHGPYIVITPGFALAHSRPDESVARTAMSFVRLAEPIAFGHEPNDPVHLVMALAAAHSAAHQAALAALAGALAHPDGRHALETASSPPEVLAALCARDRSRPGAGPPAQAPATGPEARRPAATDGAAPPAASTQPPAPTGGTVAAPADSAAGMDTAASADTVPSRQLSLPVCGNGLGTSLF